MRRLALLLTLAALLAPAAASAGSRPVSIFYYPWYGTTARDGGFWHWGQLGHVPPDDIASSFYPARGLYSSSSPQVVGAQMAEIAAAGVGEVVVSWWGQGSVEDGRLPLVAAAARARGLAVAVHLEPYAGRTVESTRADIAYLERLGIQTFYVYRPEDVPAEAWAPMLGRLSGVTVFAQTGLVGYALKGGFAGLYTYDLVTFGASSFARICAEARASGILCAPSVGPGYDARRGSGDPRVKPRNRGGTYDSMWRAAIAARADRVTITSYNEWHEGTQIEPASSVRRRGAFGYGTYDGAYGLTGRSAQTAYLRRTAHWASAFGASSLARLLFGLPARPA